MKLSDEKVAEMIAALSKRVSPNAACPFCGCHEFEPAKTEIQLLDWFTARNGQLEINGEHSIYELFAIECKNCGHIHLFNANRLKG